MEDASALVHHELFLLFICFTSLVFSSIAVTVTATIPYRLNIKLIHRDSILSPYYSPNATTSDRFRQAIENSMARFAYLKARTSKTNDVHVHVHVHVRGPLIPRDGGSTFLVIFFIGEPPVPQLLMMDTGGNLLWVQCLPCTKCLRQFSTVFDPSNSSTYANLPCNSPLCLSSIGAHCNPEGLCLYLVKYEDGTGSIGNLATEKLTFMTSDDGITNVPNMVFGCGHNNVGKLGQPSGILGLNSHKTSLISQLGSRFSYCIGNIFDPHYNYNQLIIGDGAKIEGYTTPIAVYNDFYYLTLEGISVGEKLLDIDPETFRRTPSGKGGVIIDSGTTISFLARGGYQALSVEVQNLMDGVLKRVVNPKRPGRLCYEGTVSRDLKGFPMVTFHFARGADLELEIDSMFKPYNPGEFCMAVNESSWDDDGNLTIIGIMAQQYYNVGNDLDAMELSFLRIDCQLLED